MLLESAPPVGATLWTLPLVPCVPNRFVSRKASGGRHHMHLRRPLCLKRANVFSDMLGWRVVEKFLRAMDIRDIARRAKGSTATVSRTIKCVPTVGPQTAEPVWQEMNG